MQPTAPATEIQQILEGKHYDPFHVLGAHVADVGGTPAVAVRAFLPEASGAAVKSNFGLHPMVLLDAAGFFEATFEGRDQLFSYTLQVTHADGTTHEIYDPYSFWPVLTDYDLYLFGEGTHLKAYEKLGAHVREFAGVSGVLFAVWAPNASRVSVVGDFNSWNGLRHPMRSRPTSGIWELFIPGLGYGDLYKFEVRSRSGDYLVQKADPFAFYSELRPRTASVVYDIDQHVWGDAQWIGERRRANGMDRPISIYEVHLGSWKRHMDDARSWLSYRELAQDLVPVCERAGL